MRTTKTARGVGTAREAGTATADAGELSQLPAGPILLRLRRLLITTGLSAVVYAALATGSKGQCPGAGAPGAAPGAQTCVNLTMHPSWMVFAAFAVIVFVAIGLVARRASTLEEAGRIFDRAAIVVMAVAAVSVVVGLLWITFLPYDSLTGSATVIYPFPFNSPELRVTTTP
ncbi:hypothetical protein GCM10027406_21110 [Leifsonia lichenia]